MSKNNIVDLTADQPKLHEKYVTANPYKAFSRIADARKFYEEYQNMAILVDDLDIRFWKRFVLRDYRRRDSIDNGLSEDNLRRQYQTCVSDLVALCGEVDQALRSVKTRLCHDLLKEKYIRGLNAEEIGEKWEITTASVYELIQQGLWETKVPKSYQERVRKACGTDTASVYKFSREQRIRKIEKRLLQGIKE